MDIIGFFLITRIRHITQMDIIGFFINRVIYTRARQIRIGDTERETILPLFVSGDPV